MSYPAAITVPYHQSVKRLVSAVQELSLARDLDAVMKIVRTVAREMTGADGATFVLRDGDICFYADEDAIGPLWKGSRFPMNTCISGWCMLHQKPVIIEDIYLDSRIPVDAYKPTFVKSLAIVPIRTVAPIGAIGNYWAHLHKPTVEQVELLQALADITAVTFENVKVYNDLEERVKQRTHQLEKTNQELEAFSYSVSHDLRAPLRSIISYSNILRKHNFDILDGEGKDALNTIQKNASRMNVLIDDLLQFAQFGKKELEKNWVNMQHIVDFFIKEFIHPTQNKITFQISSSIAEAFCDYSLIKQVWFNLLSNAVKYTSKKEHPVIEVGCSTTGDENVYYIKDNGAGFSMDYAHKLFGAFQRLHSSEEFEGTGVGLAIVHRIVDRHGGKVWAEGTVNGGATFYFSLPHSASPAVSR